MPFIQSNGLNIYYEQNGAGDPCLILNGTGGDLRLKPGVMESPLSQSFRVTSFDQRGLGQTDKPNTSYSMRDYAEDAFHLMQKLDLAPCSVLGISFGGMVAQELAIRHSESVSRLALYCTSSGGGGGASYPFSKLDDLPESERARKFIQLNDTRVTDDWIDDNPEAFQIALDNYNRRYEYAAEPDCLTGMSRQLSARAEHDTWDRLNQIYCPVFLSGGKFDGIATPENMQNLQSRIANSTLKLYEGGHLFMTQDRTAFADTIAFFQGDADRIKT